MFVRLIGRGLSIRFGWWTKREEVSLGALCEPAESGFIKITPREFKTRSIEDLKHLASSNIPADWSDFEKQMNCYFGNRIDLFPYADSIEACRLDAANKDSVDGAFEAPIPPKRGLSFWRNLTIKPLIDKPLPFHVIQAAMIERRFPGGRLQDIGDGDFRDLISSLRYVFARNYPVLIFQRRAWQIAFSVLIVIMFTIAPGLIKGQWDLSRELIVAIQTGVCSVAIALVWLRFFAEIKKNYENAITETCSNVRTGAQMRQQELVALLPLVFAEVDREQFEFKSRGRLDHWPMEIKKWSKVAFWAEARVEHNELFMQVEMWRIRRIHYWMRIIGLSMTGFILGVFSALVYLPLFASPLNSAPLEVQLFNCVFPLFALAALAYITDMGANSDFNLMEKALRTQNMKGSKDADLDHQVADFMFREKSAQLHEEERLSGKR